MAESVVAVGAKYYDPAKGIYSWLTNGSTIHMIGDYTTPDSFLYTPPPRDVACIFRMIVYIEDAGSFDAGKYGNNLVISPGLLVQVKDADGVLLDMLGGETIATNVEWAAQCHDYTVHSFGTGNEAATARWTFAKAGRPIYLDGRKGEFLSVTLQDSYVGLVDHRMQVQGHLL